MRPFASLLGARVAFVTREINNLIVRACLPALVVLSPMLRCLASEEVAYYSFFGTNSYNGQIAGGICGTAYPDRVPNYFWPTTWMKGSVARYYFDPFVWVDSSLSDPSKSEEFFGEDLVAYNLYAAEAQDFGYIQEVIYDHDARMYIEGNFDGLNSFTPAGTVFSAITSATLWVPDKVGISNLTLNRITAQDVFRNRSSLLVDAPSDGTITARFTPKIKIGGFQVELRLEDVARLFGVDHFNWKQTIVDPALPNGWQVEEGDAAGNHISWAPQPRLDPIPTPLRYYWLTNVRNETVPISYKFTVDTADYYYGEGTGDVFDVENWTTLDTLYFEDMPRMAGWFTGPDHPAKLFRTELVGVKADGTEVPTGRGFTWESNTYFEKDFYYGGVDVYAVDSFADFSALPPIAGGAISNVQEFFPVPEPSALALLTIAALAFTIGRWRRRRAA